MRQLTRAIERLRNYRELSDSTVNVNLKYVIHLVGEMHCPGHIYFADLPGGMDAPRHYDFFLLKYKGKEVTYHWVWDGSVSRQYPDWTEEDFRRELDKWPAEKQRAVGEGTPADWALECARSCRVVYDWAKPATTSTRVFCGNTAPCPSTRPCAGPTGWRASSTICSTTKTYRL